MECVDPYRHSFTFRYDANHRMVTQTDRRGYTFRYKYDKDGRCVWSAGEDGLYEVRLSYRPQERVTVVTKADGGEWTYFYNENNVLTLIIDPYGGRPNSSSTIKVGWPRRWTPTATSPAWTTMGPGG